MAHFAQIDNNRVLRVIVVDNNDTSDSNGVESEDIGVSFCQSIFGEDTEWKQTSYNGNMRGNYAGIGFEYIENVTTLGVGSTDIFIEPKPHESWTIDTNTATWRPPLDAPNKPKLVFDEIVAGRYYKWNEDNYQADPSTAWVLSIFDIETGLSTAFTGSEISLKYPPPLTPLEINKGMVYVWNEDNYQADPSTAWVLIVNDGKQAGTNGIYTAPTRSLMPKVE